MPFPHMRLPWLAVSLAFALGLTGCGKKGVEAEVQAFKAAGRTVSEFTDTNPVALNGKRCQTGSVDGLQALVCEYESPSAAAQGLQAVQSWIGEATPTGVALQRGAVVLGLADRSGADPSGRTVSTLGKIFRRLKRN